MTCPRTSGCLNPARRATGTANSCLHQQHRARLQAQTPAASLSGALCCPALSCWRCDANVGAAGTCSGLRLRDAAARRVLHSGGRWPSREGRERARRRVVRVLICNIAPQCLLRDPHMLSRCSKYRVYHCWAIRPYWVAVETVRHLDAKTARLPAGMPAVAPAQDAAWALTAKGDDSVALQMNAA